MDNDLMDIEKLIPAKVKGKNIDLDYHVDCNNPAEARQLFSTAANRLKNPGDWIGLEGTGNTEFRLVVPDKTPAKMQEGACISINIPGPGAAKGDGLDYVRVVKLVENKDATNDTREILLQVRPCSEPGSGDSKVAHFFDENSSSTFLLRLTGTRITASYFGRNETINYSDNSLVDKIRNTLVGVGALAGFSDKQWQGLLEGLLASDD